MSVQRDSALAPAEATGGSGGVAAAARRAAAPKFLDGIDKGLYEGGMANDLGHLLLRAQRDFEQRLVDGLGQKNHRLTAAQIAVMQLLDGGGTRLGAIAQRVATTKQAVGQVVDQLESLGLVERAKDDADARARLVRPTKRGNTLLSEVRSIAQGIRRDWKKRLGAERLAALEDALGAFAEE